MNWLDSLLLGIQRITAGGTTKTVKTELEFAGDCSVTETDDKLVVSIAGGSGSSGANAFTQTTSAFTMPSYGSPVAVPVASTLPLFVGEIVQVAGAGFMQVTALNSGASTATLSNLSAGSNYGTNTASGSTIASGALITACGIQGPVGQTGSQGDVGATGAQGIPGAGAWQALTPLTQFSQTAASTSTITTNANLTSIIKVGYALRMTVGGATQYAIVSAITSTLITIAGAPLSTTANALTAISWADSSRVKTLMFGFSGPYAVAANSSLQSSYSNRPITWPWGPARICQVKVRASQVSGTVPKINVMANLTAVIPDNSAAGIAVSTLWQSTTVNLTAANLALTKDVSIDVSTTVGATSGATLDANLAVDVLAVLE